MNPSCRESANLWQLTRSGASGRRDAAAAPAPRSAFLPAVLFAAVVTSGTGCSSWSTEKLPQEDARQPQWFEDATEPSGLHFMHAVGPEAEKYFMPTMTGSGAALFDFDGDGRLDVYLVQNGGPDSKITNRLFHQSAEGRFDDVSEGSGLDVAGHGQGTAVGDINNDGRPDVLVTEYGGVRLFLNESGGKFRDITDPAALVNPQWGTSAAFLDYDRDGWLDLVVVNYVNYDPTKECARKTGTQDFCSPKSFEGTATRLFHNCRDSNGRFEDVTIQAGLANALGAGLGVVCADLNGDHWPDILVANDGAANHLWINQQNGAYLEEAVNRGLAFNARGGADANMGIAIGDVDGNGLNDILITHLPAELPVLWRQDSVGLFQDRTGASGMARTRWRATGFGAVLADFDHMGAVHLAVANGAVRLNDQVDDASDTFWGRYAERNQMFANDGTGKLRDISAENDVFCGRLGVHRGLACGDLDNDGDLDLLVTEVAGQARLYRNVAPKKGHWLMIRAIDSALGGRDCYGAEISVTAGGKRWVRQINPGYSYLCSNDPRAHFGLGEVDQVESIEVVWPDGTTESFAGQGVDRLLVLRKGEPTP